MNSDQIFEAIEEIAHTPGKNGKIALLKHYGTDEEFCRVLKAALDPFVTYGLAKNCPEPGDLKPAVQAEPTVFNYYVWEVLHDLADRTKSGYAAIGTVLGVMCALTPNSAELLKRIITKDLRAGIDTSVNKAIPGLIPCFDVMLAHKLEEKRVKFPILVEPKLDGVRVIAMVDPIAKEVLFLSRNGKEFTSFEHIKAPLLEAVQKGFSEPVVIDGEMITGNFNKTVSEVRRKSAQAEEAVYNIFDLLTRKEFDHPTPKGACGLSFENRRLSLEMFALTHFDAEGPLKITPISTCHSLEEIHALYESYQAEGLEGVVAKDPLAPYYLKRSHAWMKVKAETSVDIHITGALEGTGKYVGMLGALEADFNGVTVKVGSGLSDEQRAEFWQAYQQGEGLLGRVIEVKFHEVTPDGSLRHPRFFRFRDSFGKTGTKE